MYSLVGGARDGHLLTVLASIAFLLTAAAAAPCPDLTGDYRVPTEDGVVIVIVEQKRCASVRIEWNIVYNDTTYSRHQFALDGRFQPDGGWFGARARQLTAARFIGDTLQLTARPREGSPTGFTSASFRTIAGGLCARFLGPGTGEGAWSFASRVRPGHILTEDERDDGLFRCNRPGVGRVGDSSPSTSAQSFEPLALSTSRLRQSVSDDQFQPPMKRSMPGKVFVIVAVVVVVAILLGIKTL